MLGKVLLATLGYLLFRFYSACSEFELLLADQELTPKPTAPQLADDSGSSKSGYWPYLKDYSQFSMGPWDYLWAKKWDFVYVVTRNTNIIEFTLLNIGFACLAELRLVDMKYQRSSTLKKEIPLLYCSPLSDMAHDKEFSYGYSEEGFTLKVRHFANSTHYLRKYEIESINSATKARVHAEINTARPLEHPSLTFLTKFDSGHFLLNTKEYSIPATGFFNENVPNPDNTMTVNAAVISGETSSATLDLSRGTLPYVGEWYLFTGQGWDSIGYQAHYSEANRIAINIGAIGPVSCQNHIVYKGEIIRIGKVDFRLDQDSVGNSDFTITLQEPAGQLTFRAVDFAQGSKDEDLLLFRFKLLKHYGVYSGWFEHKGQKVQFERLYGFVEWAKHKW